MKRLLCMCGFAAVILVAAACASPEPESSAAAAPRPVADGVEIAAVAWPAEPADTEALSALSDAARSKVAASPVPVLVPRRAGLLAAATVLAGAHWSSVATREGDVSMTLHATRAAHRYARIAPAEGDRAIRKTKGFVTRNEGIWSASWIENGAAYTLEVECAAPFTGRCADESYVLELAGELAFVGGAGVRK